MLDTEHKMGIFVGVLEAHYWGVYLDPLRAENRALPTQKGVGWPLFTTINKSINFYPSLRYTQCSTIKSHTCSLFLIL